MSESWHFCQDCGEEAGATKERDELREQVARLEEALSTCRELREIERPLLQQRREENIRLRAALEKYGRHLDICGLAHYEGSLPCRCGLTEALESKP